MRCKHERIQRAYYHMKNRCCNCNDANYARYGGRGITVCEEWLDTTTAIVNGVSGSKGWFAFKEWALSNGYSPDLTLDRIDTNRGYSPDNCRWVDYKTQNNNRRSNRLITYKGRTQTLAQWCDELGLCSRTVQTRLSAMHWSVDRALETKGNPRHRVITYKGRKQLLKDWCRELGLEYETVRKRLDKLHWSIERAFETRSRSRRKR